MTKRKTLTERRERKLWIMCLAADAPDPPYLLVVNMYPGQALAEIAKARGQRHTILKTKGHKIGVLYDGELSKARLTAGLDDFMEYVKAATMNMADHITEEIDRATGHP